MDESRIWHMGDRVVLTDDEMSILEAADRERERAQYLITVAVTEGQRAQEEFWKRILEMRPDLAREWEFIWHNRNKILRLSHRKPQTPQEDADV